MKQQFHFNEISILKVLATFLITWFHFKWAAPDNLSPILIGGVIGNSIFFYSAGYLLKFKEEYRGEWIIKKFLRLMPSIWVFLIISGLFGNVQSLDWKSYLITPFWFVNAIFCFYIIAYFIRSFISVPQQLNSPDSTVKTKRSILIVLAVIACGSFLYYYAIVSETTKIIMDDGGIHCWFYFFAFFLWGYSDKQFRPKVNASWKSLIFFSASTALFYLYKHLSNNCAMLVSLQVITVPLLLTMIVFWARRLAVWIASKSIPSFLQRLVSKLSNLTLDIYIVQVFIINLLSPDIAFPLNLPVLFIVILLSAFINNYIAKKVQYLIQKLLLQQ